MYLSLPGSRQRIVGGCQTASKVFELRRRSACGDKSPPSDCQLYINRHWLDHYCCYSYCLHCGDLIRHALPRLPTKLGRRGVKKAQVGGSDRPLGAESCE